MSTTPVLPPPTAQPSPGSGPDPSGSGPGAGDPLRSLPVALLAAATAWVSVLAWRGMAQDPGRISRPLVVAALIVALIGWAVRRSAGAAWTAVPVQLLVLLVWLMHQASGSWLPGPGPVRALVSEIGDGILASKLYYSPVSVTHPEYHFLITLGGVGIILAVDLLVCGIRQPALAGLPLLLVVTIAASVLLDPVGVPIFVGTALGWLSLLVIREAARFEGWTSRAEQHLDLARLAPVAATIAVVSVLAALVLSAGVTSQGRLLKGNGNGNGNGDGDGASLSINPLLDMRRNLREDADTPLVRVRAPSGADPEYLRLTVLDDFSDAAWSPSDRSASDTRPVGGSLPFPEGLSRTNVGPSQTWQISVLRAFTSVWLPLPTPTTSVDVDSRWRYDRQTLDVMASRGTAADLDYQVDTFRPSIDVDAARRAAPAPARIQTPLTALPSDLPPVFLDKAQQITRGADNDWDKAVALQDWFRSTGGFVYSTDPKPGNGIDTLSRFITTDKVGYCEQFATAMAVLARSLQIPARVSVGFLQPTETSPGVYTFSSRDLHAWPELYFAGQGWTRFEPTPGTRTGPPPAYTQQQADVPTPSASAAPAPTPEPTQAPAEVGTADTSSAGAGLGAALRWIGSGLLGALVLGTLVALPRLLRRRRHRRRWAGAHDPRDIADTAWAEVRETARDLDLEWSDTSSVRVNGARVRSMTTEPAAQDALDEVVRFVELTRYARPDGSDSAATRERMRSDVERWRSAAYDAADPRVARRARWWFPRR